METNIAYGVIGNAPAVENNTYKQVEMTSAPEKGCSKNRTEMKKEKKEYCFKIFITTISVAALLLVLIFLSLFLVHILYQPTYNHIQRIEQKLDDLFIRSCKDLPQGSLSEYYYIVTNSSEIIRVYCDTSTRNCSCDASVGWMRVANLDMTDPTQQCPDGFRLIDRTEPPLRTCGRPAGHSDGCVSTTFPVHGIEYSRLCGRIVGYQFGSPSGFNTLESSIDRDYMAGISLTHGLPRQHIWSFVNAQNENTTSEACPCISTAPLVCHCLSVMTLT